jgi:hypothetical protein
LLVITRSAWNTAGGRVGVVAVAVAVAVRLRYLVVYGIGLVLERSAKGTMAGGG